MDVLLIKMEKVDESFYENLLQFISESGYKSQIVSHCKEEIYDRIWGECYVSDNRNIIAYINKIRRKIEPDPSKPLYIITVWG